MNLNRLANTINVLTNRIRTNVRAQDISRHDADQLRRLCEMVARNVSANHRSRIHAANLADLVSEAVYFGEEKGAWKTALNRMDRAVALASRLVNAHGKAAQVIRSAKRYGVRRTKQSPQAKIVAVHQALKQLGAMMQSTDGREASVRKLLDQIFKAYRHAKRLPKDKTGYRDAIIESLESLDREVRSSLTNSNPREVQAEIAAIFRSQGYRRVGNLLSNMETHAQY